ncbi:MAG: type II toxin-antitoxin system Phd/YefM family antitoxin [Chloroflexota bacterium]|nr:MAG: type II toxin-antitoxin system Phd/YefM family antitoxin [Chloroflexota bacterium]
MPRTVSATEAKNRLGAIIGWVLAHKDEVIVESHGEPKVVMMHFEEYEELKNLKEQARRRAALEALRGLRQKVLERNRDLTPEEADLLAERLSREIVEDMAQEGKIEFEK